MAAMLKVSLGLSLLGFLVIGVLTPSANGSIVLGGKTMIDHVGTNKEIQDLGRYCVEQFNLLEKEKGTSFPDKYKFWEVKMAQKQVVAGIKYYLRIDVINQVDKQTTEFDSVVVVQPWFHSKKLLSFTPVE